MLLQRSIFFTSGTEKPKSKYWICNCVQRTSMVKYGYGFSLTYRQVKVLSKEVDMKKDVKIYFAIIALTAMALAMTNDVISNFFNDAYAMTTAQRGLIEFPREIPGVIGVFVIALLVSRTDIQISMLAQVLSFIGIIFLGLTTPSYNTMVLFVFINSMGMHLFLTLQDSIGISLAKPENLGRRMGQYHGIYIGFEMLGALIIFAGFRTNLFTFETFPRIPFLIAGALLACVLFLLFYLNKVMGMEGGHPKKIPFVFRKEYRFYYLLVVLYGVQKQMMLVYGPWVLITLVGTTTDIMAMLIMLGFFIGIFFVPALGRWLDRFGVRKLLFADAISFIVVYFLYGLLSAGYYSGNLATSGWPVLLGYGLFIIDRMSTQMSIIRTVYLRSILLDVSDMTPTLSLGISMDHVVSIISAMVAGLAWMRFGPQYVFFFVSALSLLNLYAAFHVQDCKA